MGQTWHDPWHSANLVSTHQLGIKALCLTEIVCPSEMHYALLNIIHKENICCSMIIQCFKFWNVKTYSSWAVFSSFSPVFLVQHHAQMNMEWGDQYTHVHTHICKHTQTHTHTQSVSQSVRIYTALTPFIHSYVHHSITYTFTSNAEITHTLKAIICSSRFQTKGFNRCSISRRKST